MNEQSAYGEDARPEFEVTDCRQNDNDMGFTSRSGNGPIFAGLWLSGTGTCHIQEPQADGTRQSAFSKRSALIINRHYCECRECGGRFAEPLESVKEGERITRGYASSLR